MEQTAKLMGLKQNKKANIKTPQNQTNQTKKNPKQKPKIPTKTKNPSTLLFSKK